MKIGCSAMVALPPWQKTPVSLASIPPDFEMTHQLQETEYRLMEHEAKKVGGCRDRMECLGHLRFSEEAFFMFIFFGSCFKCKYQ